ncbi:unnamed protein product [Allacma fusca]|nr:unnamed protein product [Allacma fusca]
MTQSPNSPRVQVKRVSLDRNTHQIVIHPAGKSLERKQPQRKKNKKESSFWSWCRCCCGRKRDRPRYLYAFDFDHTIVNENSDAAITEVVPNPIPDHIKCLYDGTNWTEFMEYIFRYIATEGATVPVLAEKIRQLELTPEMDTVLQKCSSAINRNPQSHLIIVSDANDFFISTCLLNLTPPVVPTAILSNHATISTDRTFLKIFPFEEQEECVICPRNMCKGRALKKYVIENGPFTKVFYSGDGGYKSGSHSLIHINIYRWHHNHNLYDSFASHQVIAQIGSKNNCVVNSCRVCLLCSGANASTCANSSKMVTSYLYAFDFDHTIVQDNSDTAVTAVIDHSIPDRVESVYDGSNWTEFMNHVFLYLAAEGATLDAMKDKIREMKLVPGMANLLQEIAKSTKENSQSKLVIISDANDIFISTCLSNLSPPVVPDQIITNPAVISMVKPFLQISPYENQNSCPICPKNLCKGSALKKYIESQGPFTKVFYAGDGANDLCPSLVLSSSDVVFARDGYKLAKIFQHGSYRGVEASTAAKVIIFDNGNDIADNILF